MLRVELRKLGQGLLTRRVDLTRGKGLTNIRVYIKRKGKGLLTIRVELDTGIGSQKGGKLRCGEGEIMRYNREEDMREK